MEKQLVTKSRQAEEDEAYLNSLPKGYRFEPYDEEIIVSYLQPKVENRPLPRNRIKEVELYKFHPNSLTSIYPPQNENEWYFFTPRDRKYAKGSRPDRAADGGYWKATGADKDINFQDKKVGYKKVLVFYNGKPSDGEKTRWIMHEYRVVDPPIKQTVRNDKRLDDWVLCRLYYKFAKSKEGSESNNKIKLKKKGSKQNNEVPLKNDEEGPSLSQNKGNFALLPSNLGLIPQIHNETLTQIESSQCRGQIAASIGYVDDDMLLASSNTNATVEKNLKDEDFDQTLANLYFSTMPMPTMDDILDINLDSSTLPMPTMDDISDINLDFSIVPVPTMNDISDINLDFLTLPVPTMDEIFQSLDDN